jgi:hypothetical protein
VFSVTQKKKKIKGKKKKKRVKFYRFLAWEASKTPNRFQKENRESAEETVNASLNSSSSSSSSWGLSFFDLLSHMCASSIFCSLDPA